MCDTLVALCNSTEDNTVIFGKNSDRPHTEVQLITYIPRMNFSKGEELKCTYISIPQVSETAAIVLSQPFWMWGAEMGTNEYDVAIGNEAVYTYEPLRRTGLLGMDLLRLGLERGKTAKEAMCVITDLLEKHGQGGGCAYDDPSWTYHNSFLIADPKEAYVLEAADEWWVAEKVNDVRSISNNLSIRGKGDLRKDGIIQHAIERGYCKEDEKFDFAKNFSDFSLSEKIQPISRAAKSMQLLTINKGKITIESMMEFLRDHTVGICMHGSFESTGSQISHLRKENKKSIHWFTGSTLPCLSIYKPYTFPIEGQKVLEPGPYSQINNKWFWSQHNLNLNRCKGWFKKSERDLYIKKKLIVEKEIIRKVNNIIKQEDYLTKEDFNYQIRKVNLEAWDKSMKILNT